MQVGQKDFFCNNACAAIYSNKNRKKEVKLTPCLFCGSLTKNKDTCSMMCTNFLKIRNAGNVTISNCEEYNRRVAKKYLIKTLGHSCSICKNIEWLGNPIPLIIDHVDGNASNNILSNLRLVCGNCSMTLPTFAGKNRGKGTRSKKPRH